jgi:gliding motility-associated-like protein
LDISFTGCNHIGPGNIVRCNFNNNLPGSNPGGIIGLSASSTMDNVQGGSFGNSFARALDVTAGETYLILVDNYGHDDFAGPSAGFTIDFSASTAGFQGNSPMSMTNVIKECSDSTITFDLSQPILCNSIAPDASDFSLNSSIPILGVNGVNCVAGGYTSRIVVRLGGHLPPGDYVLSARKGTDGNSLVDICGNELALPSTLPIPIPPSLKRHFISPADTTKCNYSSITLGTSWGFEKYLWYQGPATSTFKVADPGLYRLSVTDSNGCMGTDSILVKDSVCPQNVYLPSAFSPNGDGRNDLFRPMLIGATSYFRFIVFDRWGRAVFETSNPSAGWDGTINGRRQPAGVYVWMCQYTLYDRSPQVQRGTVTLIR